MIGVTKNIGTGILVLIAGAMVFLDNSRASSWQNPWKFRIQTNLLKQPEFLAEMPESDDRPGEIFRFSCSGFSGPVVTIGLGAKTYDRFTQFNAQSQSALPAKVVLRLQFQKIDPILSPLIVAEFEALAEPDATQVTAIVFNVIGGDALKITSAMIDVDRLSVKSPQGNHDIDLIGATSALKQATEACPFKE